MVQCQPHGKTEIVSAHEKRATKLRMMDHGGIVLACTGCKFLVGSCAFTYSISVHRLDAACLNFSSYPYGSQQRGTKSNISFSPCFKLFGFQSSIPDSFCIFL